MRPPRRRLRPAGVEREERGDEERGAIGKLEALHHEEHKRDAPEVQQQVIEVIEVWVESGQCVFHLIGHQGQRYVEFRVVTAEDLEDIAGLSPWTLSFWTIRSRSSSDTKSCRNTPGR